MGVGRCGTSTAQEIKSCRVADRAALDVWRRLCTGEETKRKMSAGSKINNLSARACSLSSLRFPVLFTSLSFPQRKYPKEIAGSSLAELKAVASAIFMIATQVRAALPGCSLSRLGPGRGDFLLFQRRRRREALQPRSAAAAARSQRKKFLVDRSCDLAAEERWAAYLNL